MTGAPVRDNLRDLRELSFPFDVALLYAIRARHCASGSKMQLKRL